MVYCIIIHTIIKPTAQLWISIKSLLVLNDQNLVNRYLLEVIMCSSAQLTQHRNSFLFTFCHCKFFSNSPSYPFASGCCHATLTQKEVPRKAILKAKLVHLLGPRGTEQLQKRFLPRALVSGIEPSSCSGSYQHPPLRSVQLLNHRVIE